MAATIIVSSITALAAIIAPVMTQLIARRGAYKLKTLELFFTEKAKAYREYIEVTATFPPKPTVEDLFRLNNVLNQAIVYSSEDTVKKLAKYVLLLKNSGTPDFDAIADAHLEASRAIHIELSSYESNRKHKRNRT